MEKDGHSSQLPFNIFFFKFTFPKKIDEDIFWLYILIKIFLEMCQFTRIPMGSSNESNSGPSVGLNPDSKNCSDHAIAVRETSVSQRDEGQLRASLKPP